MILAENVMQRWVETHPDDHIVVWRPKGDDVGTRSRVMAHLGRRTKDFDEAGPMDFYLSLNPTVPPTVPRQIRTGVLVHDFRHEQEPERFSRQETLYRRLMWKKGIHRADVVFTNSEETARHVTARFGSGIAVNVLPIGADHMSHRGVVRLEPMHVLAICHRANKPASTALAVWRRAYELDAGVPPLCIVGVDDAQAAELERDLGPEERCRVTFSESLGENEFDRLFASSAAVLMLSSEEGFGLPVAEAAQLDIPVVAYELPALRETLGSAYPLAAQGDVESAAALLCDAVRGDAVLHHPPTHSWNDTVDHLRAALR